jgi:hypothetical protein
VFFLVVDLAHADAVAALVVHEDESVFALAADTPENVAHAARDVHIALSLMQMVIGVADETGSLVLVGFLAGDKADQVLSSGGDEARQQQQKSE